MLKCVCYFFEIEQYILKHLKHTFYFVLFNNCYYKDLDFNSDLINYFIVYIKLCNTTFLIKCIILYKMF